MSHDLVSSSKAALFAALDCAAVGINHVELDGTLIYVNYKTCEILGYPREQVIGKTFREFTHPDDLDANVDLLEKLKSGIINTYCMEKRYVRGDQSIVWVSLTVSKVPETEKKPAFLISSIEDISARKKSEAAMAQMQMSLEELLRERTLEKFNIQQEMLSFFSMSKDLMAVLAPDGRAKRFNKAALDILGYSEAELLESPWYKFAHPDDLRGAVAKMARLASEGESIADIETRYICKDGSIRHIVWSVSQIPGSVLRFAIGRDVTVERKREKAVAEEKILMAAASKMNSLGRMASNVAHEVNNPLTVIFGQACHLNFLCDAEKIDVKKVRKISKDISDMSTRITNTIRGLQLFAREGSRDEKEVKALGAILSDTLLLCRDQMRISGVTIDERGIDKTLLVYCRVVQISQAILNLLNNAYDAIECVEIKKIRLIVERSGDLCRLLVVDSGAGVDSANMENLFEAFFTTKAVGKGTGIGLSISRQIIEDHGGTISYQSYQGQTCFMIELPIATGV